MRHCVTRVFLVISLLLCVCTALADAPDLYAEYQYVTDTRYKNDEDLINFRAKLVELGFYKSAVDGNALNTLLLTDQDIAALYEVSRLNPDIEFDPKIGVPCEVYWRVMELVDRPIVTPAGPLYKEIPLGTTDSKTVAQAQERLIVLGYDEEAGFFYTPGIYDEAMERALAAFQSCNGLSPSGTGVLSADIQVKLFGDSARAYSPALDRSLGLQARLRYFLSGESQMGGLNVPNSVLLIAGFVILCVIVFLLAKLFLPSDHQNTVGSEKMDNMVHFTIDYNGQLQHFDSNLSTALSIGRGTGAFPLHLEDESISRKHCEIVRDSQGVLLTDSSSNGTTVNDRRLQHGQCRLHNGDTFTIGSHRITIHF